MTIPHGAPDIPTTTADQPLAAVGIIANPSAGQDIRRLVAHGWNVPVNEKVNILRRVFAGLDAAGVRRVVAMPDVANLCAIARDGASEAVELRLLEMNVFNDQGDTARAAELMAASGVACVVTLGGDGTNRAAAEALGGIPLVPISTGTNNVFPAATEGTVAGLAAGLVACEAVDVDRVTERPNILELQVDGKPADVALVDVAVSTERFVGARAIWDMSTVHELFLSRAEPGSIGMSAIGAALPGLPEDGSAGLHLRIGPGGATVVAPIAPGLVRPVTRERVVDRRSRCSGSDRSGTMHRGPRRRAERRREDGTGGGGAPASVRPPRRRYEGGHPGGCTRGRLHRRQPRGRIACIPPWSRFLRGGGPVRRRIGWDGGFHMAVKKVMVTGGAGYVASQMLPVFRDRYDLVLLDSSGPKTGKEGRFRASAVST